MQDAASGTARGAETQNCDSFQLRHMMAAGRRQEGAAARTTETAGTAEQKQDDQGRTCLEGLFDRSRQALCCTRDASTGSRAHLFAGCSAKFFHPFPAHVAYRLIAAVLASEVVAVSPHSAAWAAALTWETLLLCSSCRRLCCCCCCDDDDDESEAASGVRCARTDLLFKDRRRQF